MGNDISDHLIRFLSSRESSPFVFRVNTRGEIACHIMKLYLESIQAVFVCNMHNLPPPGIALSRTQEAYWKAELIYLRPHDQPLLTGVSLHPKSRVDVPYARLDFWLQLHCFCIAFLRLFSSKKGNLDAHPPLLADATDLTDAPLLTDATDLTEMGLDRSSSSCLCLMILPRMVMTVFL